MTLKEGVDLHDREIAAIRKLILTGMKMLNRNQVQINELRDLQKVEKGLHRQECLCHLLCNLLTAQVAQPFLAVLVGLRRPFSASC